MANRDFKVRHGLDVCGNSSLGGDVAISGNLTVGGNLSLESVDLSGALQVSGSTSIGGSTTLKNTLTVSGMTSLQGGLVVDTSLDVQSAMQANSISASGQLQVDGTTSLKNTLTVSGMTSLQGGLVVDGESDFQAKISANQISASGQLTVDQQVQADGSILAGQVLRAGGSLCAQAQAFVNQDLRVTGNSDLNGTLTVCGDTTLSSTLQVKGNASISGTTVLTGGVQAKSGLDVSGTVQATGHVSSAGYLHAGTTLQVSGSASIGSLKVAGMTSLQGGLVVDTSMDVQASMQANDISSSGTLFIGSSTNPHIELSSNTSGTPYIDFGRQVGGVGQDYGGRIILDGDTTLSICAQQLHFGAQNICLNGTVRATGDVCMQTVGYANQGFRAGLNAGAVGQYDTILVGERRGAQGTGDGYASITMSPGAFGSKMDATTSFWSVWTNKNSVASERIRANFGTSTEQIRLRPRGQDVLVASSTSAGVRSVAICGSLGVSGATSLGSLKVAGTTCLQAAVDINQTLAVSGAISAPGGIHAVAGDIQTSGTISGTQLKFVSAGGQRMTVSNLDSVSGRVGTLSATKFNWTSAGGQRITISSATITSLNVSTITVNQQGNIARRISGTVASTNAGYVTAFTVNGNNLASCIEVFFEGTINSVVVACYAEIIANHSGDITIRTHQGNYTPLDIQVISNNNEDFAVLVKRNGGVAGTANLNFNVYPKGDETVTATATNPYSGTTLTHTGVRGTKITATGGQPHRFETDGEIIGKQTLTVSGLTSLQGGLVVDTSMDVQVAAQMDNISSSGTLKVQGTTTLSGSTQIKNTLSVAGSTVLSGAVQAKNTLSVGGSQTIGGTTWANGHLRLGDANAGLAMDPNEIYFAGAGNLGTLSGNLQLNPAGSIVTGKVFDSTANIQTTAIISGTQLRCTSFAGTTADIAGTLQVSGSASLGSLRVAGDCCAQGGLGVQGGIALTGELDFNGATQKYVDFMLVSSNAATFTANFRSMDHNGQNHHTHLTLVRGGAVQLAYNNNTKAATTNTGFYVSGILSATLDVKVGRDLRAAGAISVDGAGHIAQTLQVGGQVSVGGQLIVTQSICANGHVIAGDNATGRIGLSINDGYGNANITFNHHAGIPDVAGNAARIETNVDSTTSSFITLEVGSGLQAQTAQALQTAATFYANRTEINGELQALGNTSLKGTLLVSGGASFKSGVNVSGTLSARKYNFEPYGVVPAFSNSDYGTITYNSTESAIELSSSTDTSIGMAFPAWKVNVNSGNKWEITIQIRASANTTGGVYIRVAEYDAELPDGKIAVSNSAGNALVQEDTREKGLSPQYENQNGSTTWKTLTFEYTPTSTAVWASVVVLNWTGLGTNALYVREPQIKQKLVKVPDSNTLDGIDSGSFLRSDVADDSSRMKSFYTNMSSQDDYINSPISIRERDAAGSGDGETRDSPNLNFHWSGRVSNSLWMNSGGVLNWGSYNASGVPATDGQFAVGTIRSDNITNRTGQQLILNAGESSGKVGGQTAELVYANAEGGFRVSCPDGSHTNWDSGYTVDYIQLTRNTMSFYQGMASDGTGAVFKQQILHDGSHARYDTIGDLRITPDGRLHMHRDGNAGGGQNRFEGLTAASSANGRSQFILSSSYSDLVIASSQVNNNHGSTLTFATYNPSNAGEYNKFVVNQGNWGTRKQFLDFGYSTATNRTNPHSNINSTDTVLTLDGVNKRVGIKQINPAYNLDVTGTARMTGTLTVQSDINLSSELNFTGNANKYIDFYMDSGQASHLRLVNGGSFETAIRMVRDGSVESYHNNNLRTYTINDGFYINGKSDGYWGGMGLRNNYANASREGGFYLDFHNENGYPKSSIHSILFTNGESRLRFYITAASVSRTVDTRTQILEIRSDGLHNQSWYRVYGNNGYYFQSHGGGWYMLDTTWIRSYGNKSIYHNTGALRTDGTLQVGSSGATMNVPNGGTPTINSNTIWHAGNDGSGSGLDADTVDGLHSDQVKIRDARADGDITPTNFTNTVASFTFTDDIASSTRTWDSVLTMKGWTGSTYRVWQLMGNASTSGDTDTNLYFRQGLGSSWGSLEKVWTSGNDGAGSGLDADNLDGKTWTSSGKDIRGTEIYADNWFRNYNSGEGLYNQANAMHWYSQSNNSYSIYSLQNSVTIKFMTNGGNVRGYLYADTASSIGFLNAAGQWGLRYLSTDGRSPNLYFREEGNETWTGNPGNDMGKIEYHANRFYIAAGANSNRVCQFRRSGTDVGYWSNSGEIYATSSNHKVWHAGNDGSGSGLDADTVDGIQSTGFLQNFYETAINSPDASGGTWTTANSSSWGDPKFNNSFDQYRYADGSSAYVQYNIPSGYKSCWISQLQWSSGGYADCYGVQSDGGLVFLRRINTRQLVQNSNEGNPDQHDGMTITHIGSGLEHYTAIKIQNQSGRIHLTGIAWTKNENVGYEGTGMVHPAQISHQGAGSGLDADTLDGINSGSFLRSDAADSFSGTITNSGSFISSAGSVSAANFNKIRLGRSTSQFMSFYGDAGGNAMISISQSSNPKANVRVGYSVDGGATISNIYTFTGSSGTVWTSGNDGSGSGLDADTLDGLQLHTGRNNEANKVVRTDVNGYIQAGWINTTSGTSADSKPARYYASHDAYVRYMAPDHMKMWLGLTAKNTTARRDYTTNSSYWIGAMGWGTVDLNTIFDYGCGFWDSWSNPANQPSGTSHWTGFNSLHYTNSSGTKYGWQMTMGAGNPALLYVRGQWGTGVQGWTKVWNANNDGSGSGLDADTLDGIQASSFLRSDTSDTATGGTLTLRDIQSKSDTFSVGAGAVGYRIQRSGQHSLGRNTAAGNAVLKVFGGSGEFRVKGDGDCQNTFNSYSGISDIDLKENIVDANSQWDDIKDIRVRNYNFRSSTGISTHTQIGVIAQEIELVSPRLVKDSIEEDDDGNVIETRKTVAYSVLYMKAVKALQEAMDRIETLEAKVAALESGT